MRHNKEIILDNVTIEAVAAEGKALAHVNLPTDGPDERKRVLFVQFAVPGDIVKVKLTKKKKSYCEGFIIEMIKPSERRLEPFCRHFGLCGGCKWQPLPYDMQLDAKRQQVYDQLTRIGHLDLSKAIPAETANNVSKAIPMPGAELNVSAAGADSNPVRPTLGSDKTEFYRNKLEFTFSDRRWIYEDEDPDTMSPQERMGVGFHVGRFFDKVVDIEKCWLQDSPSNEIRNFIRRYAKDNSLTFFNIREHRGFLRNMMVRSNEEGEIMLVIVFFEDDKKAIEALLDALLKEFPQIKSLYYVINGKANDSFADLPCHLYSGEDAIYEKMENLRFKIGPKSFYQTNTTQAFRLYSVAREFAALKGDEVVYDLYTGTGTIAQFVSGRASKVIGIEYVKEAIDDALVNADANGIKNCEFFAGDMKDVLTDEFIAAHGRPDVVILDPPRAGIHPDVADVILRAAPKRIVYVSCNPASQARDLEILCGDLATTAEQAESNKAASATPTAATSAQRPYYDITAIQPVDMFPHTHHVENVVALEISKNNG